MTETPVSPPGNRTFCVTARVALLCAAVLTLPLAAHAAPLSAGSAMPPLNLSDRHDKPASVGPSTRWVVFTAEKAVSDRVCAVLTLMRIDAGRIAQVVMARQAAELRATLGLPAVPATP